MANYITQETFDQAVIENQDAFDMSLEEAIEAAVQQFEAQGADLSKVARTLTKNNQQFDALTTAITNLKIAPEDANCVYFKSNLETIQTECDKSLDHRVVAAKEDAYNIILTAYEKYDNDMDHCRECLKAMVSLMTTQPDLLDDKGIRLLKELLKERRNVEITELALKWARECCIMQEMNRQKLIEASIIDCIAPLLNDPHPTILQSVLCLFRSLILDDDVRVEFGKAHDHARIIANQYLGQITLLLADFRENESVMNDLLQTIASLLVRNEFCAKVKQAGAIEIVRDDLAAFKNSDKFTRISFKFLKVLAGNDKCKRYIIEINSAPALVAALRENKKSAVTTISGLSCFAAINLRSPENSKALFEAGAPEVIIECMSQHPNNEKVQQSASWAIRNMVSRSRDLCPRFLELGAEELLKNSLSKFTKSEYDIKSALRDLGCEVSLKEEWTGRGGKINTQAKR